MTSIMRRTVRGAATGLGALALVAGTAACGGLIPGGDDEQDTGGTSSEEDDKGGDDTESGKDEESTEETDAEESEAEDAGEGAQEEAADGAEDEGSAAGEGASDEGADEAASSEPLSEEDLTAVGDVYYEFMQAAVAKDGEAACSLITNPMTNEPLSGAALSGCAEGFEGEAENGEIDPEMAEMLDRSMIEGVDNGDGTAGATLMGSDAGVTMIKASDGKWYIDGSKV
ncbi:hypothetical protein CFK41_08470 [Brachybacterium ginsengisoli]|uniref:Secreted protein n=1 Tax=Brachybacterium ginsengisoli TaxID=1331682 RepID=A0A291GXH4_9MICO|nr:hypothetical protein [Brachybacterium ginsengisoli]ATG54794.1 hypothetical protein CFK41_08470 [Brachybacterium ginsengisoli]